MKKSVQRKIQKRKRSLAKRLERKNYRNQPRPMFKARNIEYEMADRVQAVDCGGIGLIHKMAQALGLVKAFDDSLELLKAHLPYHESDHVLNLCYNVMAGGTVLEDIELLRNNETYMDALGAERIPDPTTAGDFLRRFEGGEAVIQLMEAINGRRPQVWSYLDKRERRLGVIDADGTMAKTQGECKEKMDINHKGIWGYHPLILTLANTGEHLYVVNRPGNVTSHEGSAYWMNRAATLVKQSWDRVCLRGDTDFALTKEFDGWTERGVEFVFGMDAHPNLVERAEGLSPAAWKRLKRPEKYKVKTQKRCRPENVKEQVVKRRGYENQRLKGEAVAEFDYRPTKCKRTYRMAVVRKDIRVEKGARWLFDDYRYFFYITNREDLTSEEVVLFANDRCNHENHIEQLQNGVNALRMPSEQFDANWAYMVIAALAWNLKAWLGILMPNRNAGRDVMTMEFRRFLHSLMRIPCQIVNSGRRTVYRILGYTAWLEDFLKTFDVVRRLQAA